MIVRNQQLALVGLIAGFALLAVFGPQPERNTAVVDQMCRAWAAKNSQPFERCDRRKIDNAIENAKEALQRAAEESSAPAVR